MEVNWRKKQNKDSEGAIYSSSCESESKIETKYLK